MRRRTGVRRRRRVGALAVAMCGSALATLGHAAGQQSSEDATLTCRTAAMQAERDWRLPTGLLAAIGIIESGRPAPGGMLPIIWPWTVNGEGRGVYLASKAAAVGMVRSLRLRGVRLIDVGCFQVNLFYHPHAFATLEEALDPHANADAAARILSLGRLGNSGWDSAIAAYHSAVPLIGAVYLQKVRRVWPWTKSHPSSGSVLPITFAVLLSPQARLVRVVTPLGPSPERSTGSSPRLPPTDRLTGEIVQWLHQPVGNLPRVLTP
jgi:hypothetical protein